MRLEKFHITVLNGLKTLFTLEALKSIGKYVVGIVLVNIPAVILIFAVFGASFTVKEALETPSIPFMILSTLIVLALYAFNASTYPLLGLKLKGKLDLSITELFKEAFRRIPDMFILSFVGGIVLTVGFALFLIPGIFLLLVFGFAPLALLDEKLKAFEAFKRSAELTKGVRLEILLKLGGIVLLRAFIPGLLSEVHELLSFITGTILTFLQLIVMVDYYLQLKGPGNVTQSPQNTSTEESALN